MLDSTVFLIAAPLAVAWVLLVVAVLALCRIAAEEKPAQRPLPPKTWLTVRARILKSPQSDQLATYR